MANLSDKFSSYGLSLATAQVEYLLNSNTDTSGTNTNAFAYGAAGQSIVAFSSSGNWVTKRVQSIVAITPQDRITLEISEDGNEWSDAVQRFPAMESGSNKYGCRVIQVSASSNQLDVQFGGNGANGVDPWSTYTSYFWRVRVTRANLSAGFGMATASTAGLVSGGNVPGQTTGSATAAGYVGEFPTGSQRSGTGGSTYSIRTGTALTTTPQTVLTATLNKGIYLVSIRIMSENSGGTNPALIASVNIGGTGILIDNLIQRVPGGFAAITYTLPILIASNSTAVNAVAYWNSVTSTPNNSHEMHVIRVG